VRRAPALLSFSPIAVAAALVAPVPSARADSDEDTGRVDSVFFVAKSENRNQVHYGISVDRSCAPRGDAPVFAYWKMLERGPLAREPLLAREVSAYGVAEQQVLVRDDRGGRVRTTLHALPGRPIVFETLRRGGACVATVRATIGGAQAWLTSVFVQLRWPWGVAYMDLSGRDDDGRPVRERLAE
jgi:hypothetical protein